MIFLMIIKIITTIENIISKILSSFIKKIINLIYPSTLWKKELNKFLFD